MLAERPFLCYNAPTIKTERRVLLNDFMRVMDKATLKRVEDYNLEYQRENGVSPSFRQIMHALNLGSLATVQRYVLALERDGKIKRTNLGNIEALPRLKKSGVTLAPLVGEIACGQPSFAVEEIEESFALPRSIFGSGKLYMLRAFGNSMIEAGIEKGDLLIIRQQNTADDGEIVVAMIDGDATLKRIFYKGRKIILHPENKEMQDIVLDNCEIQGVLVSSIKMYGKEQVK